jgi:hypothetical protein
MTDREGAARGTCASSPLALVLGVELSEAIGSPPIACTTLIPVSVSDALALRPARLSRLDCEDSAQGSTEPLDRDRDEGEHGHRNAASRFITNALAISPTSERVSARH